MTRAFLDPQTLDEALALGDRWREGGSYVAGGSDLVIQMRRGRRDPGALISLHRLVGLDGIATADGRMRLGALTRHRDLERQPGVCDALREAAALIGGWQVRNVGTVGGNLCNASPAADLLPVLLTLGTDVVLQDAAGRRRLPLPAFLHGPGKTARRAGELLVGIDCDAPSAAEGTAFLKFGRRQAMEIAVVSVAARVALDDDARWVSARVAVGAAAPTALRIDDLDDLLHGHVGATTLEQAGRLAAGRTRPLDDNRASAGYRRHLVSVLVPRALARAHERALRGVRRP